jgi:phosphoglycerate kinase
VTSRVDYGLRGMDNVDIKGKTVLMRIDINTPLDPETGEFLNDFRLRSNVGPIVSLLDRHCKLVLLAHQGDPGEGYEFTSMRNHAQYLSNLCNKPVKFVADIFGDAAVEEIKLMNPGECLMLENVRFYSEEKLDRLFEEHAKNYLVKTLSKVADIYINNAFSAVHRNHSSITGFPLAMPSYVGELMHVEIEAFSKVINKGGKPKVLVVGGSKIKPKMKMLEKGTHNFDKILMGGLVANLFIIASGKNIGDINLKTLEKKGALEYVDVAKRILKENSERIELPEDLIIKDFQIMDIGSNTIEKYKHIISNAKEIIFNGPMGMIENPLYARGTEELAKAITVSGAYKVVCGGHTPVVFEKLRLSDRIDHISTGGGAALLFIGGYDLPALSSLKRSQALFCGGEANGKSQTIAEIY